MPHYAIQTTVITCLGLVAAALAAIGPTTNLNIVNAVVAPDGFPRSTVLADGQFPGPLIRGNKGDKFSINVFNALTDKTMERSTSIHWHGIFQQGGTNYEDGAASVTQCPIVPKNGYQYDFSVPDQAGTFWYHSHVGLQYCDGLRGPFVVYDPEDPHQSLYDVDDESTVITLADWYHLPANKVPVPFNADSTLINGLGRYQGGPKDSPLSVVNVTQGLRYRFRLVSMACNIRYNFTIDDHQMTIIEVDGVNVEPLVVDSIQIFSGQRYSFVLEAKQNVNNYRIRAEPREILPVFGDGAPTGFRGGINSAILRYAGAPAEEPTSHQSPSVIPLLETNLHPLENPGAPGGHHKGGADVELTLNLAQVVKPTGNVFTINGVTFEPPSVPVLLQILSGSTKATDLLPKGSVYTLPSNKVIELHIPGHGIAGSPHPFHLHGHTFDVIRSAGNSTYNYANPVRRDVVSTGNTSDNVTIRFVTDNSGPWMLHCHINFHLNTGMAVVLVEDVEEIAIEAVPKDWKALCPKYEHFNSPFQE
ncbi:multicopper oxidase [Athelia psychrophila]|uniref:Multicopper oxidase n=1 Tax=Athelia psychrophila TaxID=1759441 RepID=A0A166S8S2_9AGAM|nr:multicopper oxidase [Fibularhizoctonia sp. CBS 109695]